MLCGTPFVRRKALGPVPPSRKTKDSRAADKAAIWRARVPPAPISPQLATVTTIVVELEVPYDKGSKVARATFLAHVRFFAVGPLLLKKWAMLSNRTD